MAQSSQESSDRDTLYVLVTGANGGVGYAICTRLISNFLSSRPATQHLHLVPTARSSSKGEAIKSGLEQYIRELSQGRKSFFPYIRGGTAASQSNSSPKTSLSPDALTLLSTRISITPLSLDLCSFQSIDDAAVKLPSLVPRIDVAICNAGIGGWTGLNWFGFMKQILTEGLVSSVTAPKYKISTVGAVTQKQLVKVKNSAEVTGAATAPSDDEPQLGQVFCANVFGHYVFTHKIQSLLQRDQESPRARVIWISTLEAYPQYFSIEDMQGLKSNAAYESSKRLTDFICLTSTSPLSSESVNSFFDNGARDSVTRARATKPTAKKAPEMLLCHPGICMTPILPLLTIMIWMQSVTFLFVRILGSKWHTVSTIAGATAPVWLALEHDEVLEESKAREKKWGSAAGRWGEEEIMETEVEGLGTAEFEKMGAEIWSGMESLRHEWEELLKL